MIDEPLRSEEQLKAVLRRRTSEFGALAAGSRLALKTLGWGLGSSILFGAAGGAIGFRIMEWTITLQKTDAPLLQLWFQIAAFLAGLSLLYLVLQFTKRARATRASWAPALLTAPLTLLAIGLFVVQGGQARQIGPVVLQLVLMAWGLAWASFGGAILAIVWNRTAKNALDGKRTASNELLAEVQSRWLEVAGPHGARVHAVTLGIQILLPGIFYALQLAFVDMVTVLDPEKPALRRAGQLSSGMRGRLFRLLLVWWVATTSVWFLLTCGVEGITDGAGMIEKFQELFLDPSATTFWAYTIGETWWVVSGWVCELALLVLYLEREEQVRARTELKRLQKESGLVAAAPTAG